MKMVKRRWLWLLTALVVPVGFTGIGVGGNLQPPGAPGSTMKTLDEIPPAWSQKIPDASKRFQIVLDGAGVLDKETGLVWEKSPDTTSRTWSSAVYYAYSKNVGGRKGWRPPTAEELASLVDPTQQNPSLPSGHPFANVKSTDGSFYWSSTTGVYNTIDAWVVTFFSFGSVYNDEKSVNGYVWCVRGGHGHDAQ